MIEIATKLLQIATKEGLYMLTLEKDDQLAFAFLVCSSLSTVCGNAHLAKILMAASIIF